MHHKEQGKIISILNIISQTLCFPLMHTDLYRDFHRIEAKSWQTNLAPSYTSGRIWEDNWRDSRRIILGQKGTERWFWKQDRERKSKGIFQRDYLKASAQLRLGGGDEWRRGQYAVYSVTGCLKNVPIKSFKTPRNSYCSNTISNNNFPYTSCNFPEFLSKVKHMLDQEGKSALLLETLCVC